MKRFVKRRGEGKRKGKSRERGNGKGENKRTDMSDEGWKGDRERGK